MLLDATVIPLAVQTRPLNPPDGYFDALEYDYCSEIFQGAQVNYVGQRDARGPPGRKRDDYGAKRGQGDASDRRGGRGRGQGGFYPHIMSRLVVSRMTY